MFNVKTMNLNKLRDEAYSIAKANGWHEQEYSDEHYLMLVITEVAEAVQADRDNRHADVDKFKKYQEYYKTFISSSEEILAIRLKEDFEAYIKNTVEDELADVVIRCLDLAGVRGIDLEEVALIKEQFERFKEGKNFIDLCYVLSETSTCDDSTEEKVNAIIALVLKYCELTAIDIDFFIHTKMNYNRLRGYHHGGKRY